MSLGIPGEMTAEKLKAPSVDNTTKMYIVQDVVLWQIALIVVYHS